LAKLRKGAIRIHTKEPERKALDILVEKHPTCVEEGFKKQQAKKWILV